jgi:hypothetical protein
MSFSLKPYQLIAFWIPGFVVLAIISFADLKSGHNHLKHFVDEVGVSFVALAFAVAAFAIGSFLDCIRNLLEDLISKFSTKHAIKWSYIWKFNKENFEKMEEYYFTYYVFDFNMAGALLLGTLAAQYLPVFSQRLPCWMLAIILIAAIIFILDCLSLRSDIVKLSNKPPVANEETT